MFCILLLLLAFVVINVNAEQSAYESLEELACWQCVTDTTNGYRVLRKRSGCVNVFAIFAKNGECADMFAYKVTPGGTGVYSTESNVFPRDSLAVSRTIWETRGRKSDERLYSLSSYALQDEVTREWCGVLDFDNEELSVGLDGSCVVRKHCGYPVGHCGVFDALDKNSAEAFQLPKGKEGEKTRLLESPSGFGNKKKPENEKTVSGRQTSSEKGRKGVEVAEGTEQNSRAASVSASLQTGSKKGEPLSKGVKSRNLKVDDVRCKDGGDLMFSREGVSDSNLDDHVSTGVRRSGSVSSVVYSKSNEESRSEVAVSSHLQPSCSTLNGVRVSEVPASTRFDSISNSAIQPVPFQLADKEVTGDVRGLSLSMNNRVRNRWGSEGKKSEKLPFAFSHGGKRWAVVYARKVFVREDGTSKNEQLDNHGLAVLSHEHNIRSPMSTYCMYKDETSMIFQHRFYTYVSLPNGMNAPTKVECSLVPNFEIIK